MQQSKSSSNIHRRRRWLGRLCVYLDIGGRSDLNDSGAARDHGCIARNQHDDYRASRQCHYNYGNPSGNSHDRSTSDDEFDHRSPGRIDYDHN